LLRHAIGDGPNNMAADEVLLESAGSSVASLRLYGWAEATVSLGYFQPERLRRADDGLAGLPFVRRPSGGATLVHHHEVTYALGLPPGLPWQTDRSWLCRMHQIIAAALRRLGVVTGPGAAREDNRFSGLLCFQHFTPGDLLIGQAKVVGSAQRKQRGALMQHGGILLATSPYTPVLPGIRELTGRRLSHPELCAAIEEEFVRDTAWELVPGDWTVSEGRRKEELVATKYSTDKWNRKR
jgi:lipoate-protein ligase A